MVIILENKLKFEFSLGHDNCNGKKGETTVEKYILIETKL